MKNLLLCFIHGFKSDDGAFYDFPTDVQRLVQKSNQDVNISVEVYPTYETRGDLPQSVAKFREWLQKKATEVESTENAQNEENETPGVVLVAHSMGGLVAADALFSILDDGSEPQTTETKQSRPKILGILAFDTPYCGLSRSMFAYGAFAQYQTVSSAYSLATSLSALALPGSANAATKRASVPDSTNDKPAWKLWQMIAVRTGAAGAIAAAGAAAYMNREQIGKGLSYMNRESIQNGLSSMNLENVKQALSMVSRDNIEQGLSYMSRENIGNGFTWLSGHLRFVSHLMKREELQERIDRLTAMEGVGFANLYTSLGENSFWSGGYFVAERTFCAVPTEKSKSNKFFIREVNPKCKDEVDAHVHLFEPNKNLGYEDMLSHAKGLIVNWTATHSGNIIDHYAEQKASQAKEKEESAKKEPSVTKYSYNETSGLKEVKPTSKDSEGNTRWLDGLSGPRYISLKKYVPSMGFNKAEKGETQSSDQDESATKSHPDGTGTFDEESTEASNVEQTSARASIASDYRDAVSEHDEAIDTSGGGEDEDDEMMRIDTEHIPGVTEDLDFSDQRDRSAESQPSLHENANDPPASESTTKPEPSAEHNIDDTSPKTDDDDPDKKSPSPVSEVYESFPSVETPSYETFAPLTSNPPVGNSTKRSKTESDSTMLDASVITKDYAPRDAKARPAHTLTLDPAEASRKKQQLEKQKQDTANGTSSFRKASFTNGTSAVHANAQRPEADGKRRRSDVWQRWRRASSQRLSKVQSTGQIDESGVTAEPESYVHEKDKTVNGSATVSEAKNESTTKPGTGSWQWQPWKWWKRSGSLKTTS